MGHRRSFLNGVARGLSAVVGAFLLPATITAQTEYFRTDVGRPVRVEDAYAVDRYALDFRLAPLRLERGGGVTAVSVTPALTYGIVPRTQVAVAVPVEFRAGAARARRTGIAGVDIAALYNFNAQTRSLPAFGVRVGLLMPVGEYGPERNHPSITGLATRTLPWARVHANAQYTFGGEPGSATADDGVGSANVALTRWLTGVAADHVFAYHSLLATTELFVAQPVVPDAADVEWTVATGLRYQLNSVVVLDGGVGRRMTGLRQAWFVTLGVSRTSAVRVLFPGRGAWGP